MKYYLIAGEASGDLHASNLMRQLKAVDADAEFRFYGGELMEAVGGTLKKHYRELAYMGFVPVVMHLGTILRGMKDCEADIVAWKPDAVVLVDYPGFNLKVAKFVKTHTDIPVYYYISPKVWAWKEWRVKDIRKYVDEVFSILPFEVEFFKKHDYDINYVGNPCADAVDAFMKGEYGQESFGEFSQANHLPEKRIIALLAGSRRQEIKDNLHTMIEAAAKFTDYQMVIAGAPNIEEDYYRKYMPEGADVSIVEGQTYRLLKQSTAALVTSGTATLETALLRVPQVVCYYTACGRLVSLLRRMVLKVKYISLVNLIDDSNLVTELVADGMTRKNVERELEAILPGGSRREQMLTDYERMAETLGGPGASERAAQQIVTKLHSRG